MSAEPPDRPFSREEVERLLERHLPTLQVFVRLRMGRVLGERESGRDLVQSVCREVLEHADRVRHGGEDGFERWLFTMALRKIGQRFAYYGAKKRDAARDVRLWSGSDPGFDRAFSRVAGELVSPSRGASLREDLARLEAAFDLLSEEQRDVIVRVRLLGEPHAEVARQLDKSEAATRSLLFRALAKLSEHMAAGPG